MELVLYNEQTEAIQMANVRNMSELNDIIEAYFGFDQDMQIIKFNGELLDNFTKLKTGDMLTINKKDNDTINHELNAQVQHTLLYIKGEYNNVGFKIIMDSGAQMCIMSHHMANRLGIFHLIDKNYAGMAHGIGTQKILGCIMGLKIKLGNGMVIPINFKVLETNIDKWLMIFGLDFLYGHQCKIDFSDKSLTVDNIKVRLLNEKEVNDYKNPVDVMRETVRNNYSHMINGIPNDQRDNIISIIKKIANNITANPTTDKYKTIDTKSKLFQNSIAKYPECVDFMKDLGFVPDGEKLKFTNGVDVLNYLNVLITA